MNHDILFVRQKHEAEVAGLHYDYRVVIGDKAYSWATKKDLPQPGKPIILWEQPLHDKEYALSEKVEIPHGQYGAGVTTLDFAQRGKAEVRPGDCYKLSLNNGHAFTIKKLPSLGEGAWLFMNTTKSEGLDGLAKSAEEGVDKPKPVKPVESVEVKPHHARVLEKLDEEGGVIAKHSLGSGKTRLGLLAIQRAQQRSKTGKQLAVVPASLADNFQEEAKKAKINIDLNRVHITTYDKLVNNVEAHRREKYNLAVVDEAHKLRNSSTARSKHVGDVVANADQRLLLTGTPIYNHVSDAAPLVNIAAGGVKVLPTEKKEFEKSFVADVQHPRTLTQTLLGISPGSTQVVKNAPRLKQVMQKYVHHYDALDDNPEDFARLTHSEVRVPMSSEQKRHYKYVEGNLPFPLRLKIRMGLPLDKKESNDLNAFSTGVRQVSNTHKAYSTSEVGSTPKIKAMADSIANKMSTNRNYRGVSYSNFLDSGLTELSKELTDRGIHHRVYTGSLTHAEKKEVVKDYNEGKFKHLLISSSGSEGLNLKGVRHVQIMEPHFNKSKIDQVIGRARRYKSHEHLPESERSVEVEHFVSTFPDGFFGKDNSLTIDGYLRKMSDDKHQLTHQISSLAEGASK